MITNDQSSHDPASRVVRDLDSPCRYNNLLEAVRLVTHPFQHVKAGLSSPVSHGSCATEKSNRSVRASRTIFITLQNQF